MEDVGLIASRGIAFFVLLAIVFIGLKLSSLITWDWLWVLAPIWGPTAVIALMLCVAVIISMVADA